MLSKSVRAHRGLLLLTAFVSGAATLAVETGTKRLIASFFSSSNVVWAGVIGMTLLYLMVGYFLGGRLIDRWPSPTLGYGLTAWAALGVGVLPAVSLPVLRAAIDALQQFDIGTTLLASFGVGILFLVPVTLLGCVVPVLIRLSIQKVISAGQVTGLLYAVSTLGGLAGVFGTTLYWIPHIGTPATFSLHAIALMAVALVGLSVTSGWRSLKYAAPAVVLLAIVIPINLHRPLKPPLEGTTLLYEAETPYNYIQVDQLSDGTRYLLINESLAVHSIYSPTRLDTGGSWDFFAAAPFFNAQPYTPDRVQKMALIGLAAGTVARQYTAAFGPVHIDGIELDPGVVAAGRRYFEMNEPNLNVIVQDGRFALRQLGGGYQVIGIDAYRPPYIPWQLTTREFFQEVQSHLAWDGVVVINVGRTDTDRRLIQAMTATLLQVFPSVHTMDVPDAFNSVLVATNQPTDDQNLALNTAWLSRNTRLQPFLKLVLDRAAAAVSPTQASSLVFTDDRAPVEMIADTTVLGFMLEKQGNAPALPWKLPGSP